jgi:FemAB-related protein (PEP-CTERM system-associated)
MSTAAISDRAAVALRPESADSCPAVSREGGGRPSDFAIRELTGRDWAAWDRFVRGHAQGTLFHTMAWMQSVRDAFGHEPRYLFANRGGRVVGALPLFRVKSLLGGTMLVSVPYAVAGGVVAEEAAVRVALLEKAKELAASIRASVIELRSEQRTFTDLDSVDTHVVFKRELPAHRDDVLGWLPRKARAAARNAENRHGLTVEFSRERLGVVWRLYCRNMRRLGSLSYPYRFFEELCERLASNSYVQVVRHGRRVVAGLVSFRFRDTFLPYFAGCDERFNRLGVNNFLYLAAMRRAVEVGCRVFDFGRTRIDNTGTYNFKRFNGFEPAPLGYQRYVPDGAAAPDLSPGNPRYRLARRLWRYLPLPVSAQVGAWISRHVPG